MQTLPWNIWIDTGGTFTDCIAVTPHGQVKRLKVLSTGVLRVAVLSVMRDRIELDLPIRFSTNFLTGFTVNAGGQSRTILDFDPASRIVTLNIPLPAKRKFNTLEITSHEEVPVFASRILTETGLHQKFPLLEMKLGSTRGTNALLERKGARTAFIVTKGFKDLLIIGNQQRPDLFSLSITRDAPLYTLVMEADERIDSNGSVVVSLTGEKIDLLITALKKKKIESVAIAFLNSYKNPLHELRLGKALKKAGLAFVSPSHKLSAQLKILPRAETAIVNAYLEPIIHRYISSIRSSLQSAGIKIMSSAGGLLDASDFMPKDSLLSGPAGGIIGALAKAKQSGLKQILTFDMGGTSTDVSRCAGRPDYRFDCSVGSLKILSPSLAIETIASGGGSICQYDGFKLTVGPHSAGASPGPACYGAGGPLTITDVNLLLGRLDPDNFPIPMTADQADAVLKKLIDRLRSGRKRIDREQVLESFLSIANEKMAEAIRKISVQQGHDPKEYALLCFGGAGGQHACALASLLGIKQILIPYDAGLLSAYGIGHAVPEIVKEKLILKKLPEVIHLLDDAYADLYGEAVDLLRKHHGDRPSPIHGRLIFLRLKGQETALGINFISADGVESDFIKRYRQVYGHYLDQRDIEVESIRIIVAAAAQTPDGKVQKATRYVPVPEKTKPVYISSAWKTAAVFRWENLLPGAFIDGPALVISDNSTVLVDEGWNFEVDEHNSASLIQIHSSSTTYATHDAAQLELFTNRFTAIAEEMGTLLQRTAFSVNVKERLDFSCALLDDAGNLVVNAPHIPVHLGSLGVCVRAVMKTMDLQDGDVIITNHPAFGGSHLPDITLIKPVFYKGRQIGFVVNRAHHAEIGGKKPGSMPADATCLEEEGVVITPTYLVRRGAPRWQDIKAIFSSATFPTRSIEENFADINAALASLQWGADALVTLCENLGPSEVMTYMSKLRAYAARLMQEKISTLSHRYQATEKLDDGTVLNVNIRRLRNTLRIDFTGSSPVHPGNLNATTAIVSSVVLYVLRLLVNKPVPLNEGLLQPVKLVLPHGILNPAFAADHRSSPAVVGGNTELSQRLTDTLVKAFGLAACSQGTMNNFLFGNSSFGYYETICGGVGAGPGFDGADAVHQHMTNTRITDPEIMEFRYPVRLERFEVRKNSGGRGNWKGGNGIVREILFLEFLDVNILSQHRIVAPYGMKGGENGKKGNQYLLVQGKQKKGLGGIEGIAVSPGDKLVIETPGGGGWGKK